MVSKLYYLVDLPQRSDIIVFDPPFDFPEPYIKRMIGLPGDEVSSSADGVIINGIQLLEYYVPSDSLIYGPDSWIVSSGALFMMGDNRDNSSESRVWGFKPVENIIENTVYINWPLSQWSAFSRSVIVATSNYRSSCK